MKDGQGRAVIEFAEGRSKEASFPVHNPLTVPQSPSVKQLGLTLSQTGGIQADAPGYQTNISGVFAAGDCISPFKVVPHAIASGNFTAVAAATQLQVEKYGHFSIV